MKKQSKYTSDLQVLQNKMIRIILNLKIENHINMQNVREKLRMFSVNQMAAYHTLLEGYNIMRNSSSELIETKWTKFNEMNYRLRSQTNNELKVPEKPKHKCTGFT